LTPIVTIKKIQTEPTAHKDAKGAQKRSMEKVITTRRFVIDASEAMLCPESGGVLV
jgi:hypothetical protein